ncbi:MAG: preprotein translocase subunit SecE [Planctomycetota bacterium]|nr:MAG: preprotein translocase subunit SecE [Planctomycetota bacterium]
MKTYKEDQGRIVRLAAFWLCVFLLLYGCIALETSLSTFLGLGEKLGDYSVPLVGWPVTWALIVSITLFVGGAFALHFLLQKPKNADLLIDTETELRKVTWPTMDDVVNSSIVVVLSVLFLLAFLFGADYVIGRIMTNLLLG